MPGSVEPAGLPRPPATPHHQTVAGLHLALVLGARTLRRAVTQLLVPHAGGEAAGAPRHAPPAAPRRAHGRGLVLAVLVQSILLLGNWETRHSANVCPSDNRDTGHSDTRDIFKEHCTYTHFFSLLLIAIPDNP